MRFARGQLLGHDLGIALGAADLLQRTESRAWRRADDAVWLGVPHQLTDPRFNLWSAEVPSLASGRIAGGQVQTPTWPQSVSSEAAPVHLLAYARLGEDLGDVGTFPLEQLQRTAKCDLHTNVFGLRQPSVELGVADTLYLALVNELASREAPNPSTLDVGDWRSSLGRSGQAMGVSEGPRKHPRPDVCPLLVSGSDVLRLELWPWVTPINGIHQGFDCACLLSGRRHLPRPCGVL